MGRPRVLLVSGLWPYNAIGVKKSLMRLNVRFNEDLKESLTTLVGVSDLIDVCGSSPQGPLPLFELESQSEPTLVSVALRQLIPSDVDLYNLEISDLVSDKVLGDYSDIQGFDIALVSTSFVCNFHDLRLLVQRVQNLGVSTIVAGGFLASRNPSQSLENGVDVVVTGDSEAIMGTLIRALAEGQPLHSIPNLAFKSSSGVRHTPKMEVELDSIPVPIPSGIVTGISVPYESMRGCPYKCAFCSYPLASEKWRYKSATKMIDDFEVLERLGAKDVVALDSTFTVPPGRLRDFLRLYQERELTIPWGAYSRVTPLKDRALTAKLAEANNKWLSIGIESGSQLMLDNMNKGTRVLHARQALENMWHSQIKPWSNFIVGFPGETRETILETSEFMKIDLFGIYGLYVFNVRDQGMPIIESDWAMLEYEWDRDTWTHATMNSDTATELRWELYLDVATSNPRAINVDVFRGTGVEKRFGAWDGEFRALKAIELYALWFNDPDGMKRRGLDQMHVEREIRHKVMPRS